MIGIGYPSLLTGSSTVSGGDWLTALPADNILTTKLEDVARSTDDAEASTKLQIDHGSARSARALVLVHHNLSSAATVRWKRGTTAGDDDVADSGALAAWAITPLERSGQRHQVLIVLPEASSARHETIEISDTSNPDGYVEVGFVWIGAVFVPTYNASYGLRHELQSMSALDRGESAAGWPTRRRTLRGASFVLELLSHTEGETLHELQRVADVTEPVLYLPDLSDRAHQQRFGGVGTLSELSALDYPYFKTNSLPLRWTELA